MKCWAAQRRRLWRANAVSTIFAPVGGDMPGLWDRRTIGGRNILDRERFKLKQPEAGYPARFSTSALSQIEAKLLLAGI
jgi:hypothetical protein